MSQVGKPKPHEGRYEYMMFGVPMYSDTPMTNAELYQLRVRLAEVKAAIEKNRIKCVYFSHSKGLVYGHGEDGRQESEGETDNKKLLRLILALAPEAGGISEKKIGELRDHVDKCQNGETCDGTIVPCVWILAQEVADLARTLLYRFQRAENLLRNPTDR